MTIYLVIAICVVSFMAFNNGMLMNKLIFNPYIISRKNEWYRFLTSGFLHADWIHLAINMYVLYIFGSQVEIFYGFAFGKSSWILYLLLFVLSVIMANVSTYYKHHNHPHYNALGASGAVSAIVFVYILFMPFQTLYLMAIIPMPAIVLGVLYLVYSSYMGKKGGDNINHDAHFYGALFGVFFTIVCKPKVAVRFYEQVLGILGL